MTVANTFTDIVVPASVPFAHRPEAAKLQQAIQPGDMIIAPTLASLFGLAHDALDTLQNLRSRDIQVYPTDIQATNDCGRIIRIIMTAFAEPVSDTPPATPIIQYGGGFIPFGWRKGDIPGTLVEDPHQQGLISRMVDAKNHGWSLRTIAKRLAERHGVVLSHTGVAKVIAAAEARERKSGNNPA